MEKSSFNTEFQQKDVASKIVVSLERISGAFKSLLWDHAKQIGLSPIQIQILIFVSYHKEEWCKVSYLANEFNITKPTISDAVKILSKKGMIRKEYSNTDSRSYSISLTSVGKHIVKKTEKFASPIKLEIDKINKPELQSLYKSLTEIIFKLNQIGVISVQRTCFGCRFYQKTKSSHFCSLLNMDLLDNEIRVDCNEFDEKY